MLDYVCKDIPVKVFTAKPKSGNETRGFVRKPDSRIYDNNVSTQYTAENLKAYHLNKLNTQKIAFRGQLKLGSHYDESRMQLDFGVFSANATSIELYLYKNPVGEREVKSIPLKQNSSGEWFCSLDKGELKEAGFDIEKGDPVYYGYRAWGPNWAKTEDWKPGSTAGLIEHVDSKGNRFNPNKLLTDPYAREISHDPIAPQLGIKDNTIYATGPEYGHKDSGILGSKSVFILNNKKTNCGIKPTRPLKDEIVYEVHLRGLTKLNESIPEEYRGTYKGAGMMANYLKDMGYTAIEFLPVQEFQNDQNNFNEQGKGDYWGYNTNAFFAPDRRYSADKSAGGPTREFKEMTKAFHDAGIKVYMDVVYNHTGEGGLWGNDPEVTNLYSLRGLDSSSYYETNDGKFFYDNTGCGANINAANKNTRKLVVDSLKYWSEEMGVDGFRFDLATVLGNSIEKDGFHFNSYDRENVLNKAPIELPVRPENGGKGIDLIAEPWGASGDSYKLGQFPKGWSEWNDVYRNTIRKAINKLGIQDITPGELASSLAGSSNIFSKPPQGRDRPSSSVNFITAHDGFTLYDLFSYNKKNNVNSDGGSDDNLSWDHGNDEKLKRQSVRTGMSLLMTSAGVPMVVGGDEMLRTTNGNNNPYNLDNDLNYLKWNLTPEKDRIRKFCKNLNNFRREHPALRPGKYVLGRDLNGNGLKQLTWYNNNADEPDYSYYDNPANHFIAYRVDGTEFSKEKEPASSIYFAYNKGGDDLSLKLPDNLPGKKWKLVCDTSSARETEGNFFKAGKATAKNLNIKGRSSMIFMEN